MNGLLLTSVVSVSMALVVGCGDADRYSSRYRAGGGTVEDPTLATDPAESDDVGSPGSTSSGDVDSGGGGTATVIGTDGGSGPSPGPTPGTDGGGAPANVFAGQPAFVAGTGPSTNGHPGGDPAGKACFGCHGNGEFSMVMGGTVYANAAGTAPAAQTEVVFKVGAEVFTAFTNAQGNFLVRGPRRNGAGMAGARSAASTNPMIGAATSGDCNSCHDGTTTARIHVP